MALEACWCSNGYLLAIPMEGPKAGKLVGLICRCPAGEAFYQNVRKGLEKVDKGNLISLEKLQKELGWSAPTADEKRAFACKAKADQISTLKRQLAILEKPDDRTA